MACTNGTCTNGTCTNGHRNGTHVEAAPAPDRAGLARRVAIKYAAVPEELIPAVRWLNDFDSVVTLDYSCSGADGDATPQVYFRCDDPDDLRTIAASIRAEPGARFGLVCVQAAEAGLRYVAAWAGTAELRGWMEAVGVAAEVDADSLVSQLRESLDAETARLRELYGMKPTAAAAARPGREYAPGELVAEELTRDGLGKLALRLGMPGPQANGRAITWLRRNGYTVHPRGTGDFVVRRRPAGGAARVAPPAGELIAERLGYKALHDLATTLGMRGKRTGARAAIWLRRNGYTVSHYAGGATVRRRVAAKS